MDVSVAHASFTRRRLSLRSGGMLHGPKLLQDGVELVGKKGKYEVRDDDDRARVVRVKGRFVDPVPYLEIDGEAVHAVRPLTWYEYAWMGLPIVLVVSGGALGGALGFSATYSSGRVFRSERSTPAKYALSALISVGAVMLFLVLLVMLELLLM